MITKNTLIGVPVSTNFNDLVDGQETFKIVRVLAVDAQSNILYVIDIVEKNALPQVESLDVFVSELENKNFRILREDPFAALTQVKDNELPEIWRQKRDTTHESIEKIVTEHEWELFQPTSRGKLVRQAAKDHGTTRKRILTRLRRYWQRGMIPNALLPDYLYSGGRGKPKTITDKKLGRPSKLEIDEKRRIGVPITENIKDKIARYYKLLHLKQGKSVRAAYLEFLNNEYGTLERKGPNEFKTILPPQEELPTYKQFLYWGKQQTSETERQETKWGNKYPLRARPLRKTSKSQAFGPGSIYQIDATIGDIYLVSRYDRSRIIGRPVIYFVIDTATRMIVGFTVTLEGPSWESAMLAIESITQNKVELCRKFGVEITEDQWPCQHLCHQIFADRGELLSNNALELVRGLGITKSNTPPYRGDLKGIVERHFRTINDKTLKWVPGYVYKLERGDKDYRLDATFNLDEFTKIIILLILNHNNHHRINSIQLTSGMVKDGVDKYPIELWTWGIKNQSGALRTMDQTLIQRHLLPQSRGSIRRTGIYFKKLHYISNDPELDDYFHKANRGAVAVDIAYDPRCVDTVFVILNSRDNWIPCQLKDSDLVFQGCSFAEHEDAHSIDTVQAQKKSHRDNTADINMHNAISSIIEKAKKEKKQVAKGLSKREQVKDIGENRKGERNDNRKRNSFIGSDYVPDNNPESENDEETYVPKNTLHDELKSFGLSNG